jgi:SAM-dependent methyltransferase
MHEKVALSVAAPGVGPKSAVSPDGRERESISTLAAWSAGAPDEIAFWRDYLRTGGLQWPSEFQMRVDPTAILTESQITSRLPSCTSETVRIIDVGAGPLTTLGKSIPGRRVELHATDALGHHYVRLMKSMGIRPMVPTERCHGEDLDLAFPSNYFDFAYARNALDHCHDTPRVIANMVWIVKGGGWVILRHRENEAVSASYRGLHQWNFEERDGDTYVWNQQCRISLTDAFERVAQISTERDGEWLVIALHKHRFFRRLRETIRLPGSRL